MNACLLLMALLPSQTPALLAPGGTLTLRIRQVLPQDNLSPGERLLNSLPPLQIGDGFVAEIVQPPGSAPVLLVGHVSGIAPPGWFGRPGRVTLELGQLVGSDGAGAWQINAADERYLPPRKRRLLATLLALEGLGIGASVAAQFQPVKSGWVAAGAGIGLVLGVAYATCLPGREAALEPGDTFRVTLGSCTTEQVAPEVALKLYPAQPACPSGSKHR